MSQKLKQVHERAVERFDIIISKEKDERQQALEDRRFSTISGAQYEGKLDDIYENKARFEINKSNRAVRRILNEYRANRVTVDFRGKNPVSQNLASFCEDKFRADEYMSNAKSIYDNAFQEGVKGGMGGWRLVAKYEDDTDLDSEDKIIGFEPVYDADCNLFFDPASKMQDKSDARYGYLLTPMTKEDYKQEYNDDLSGWSKEVNTKEFDWVTDDTVYVAEYYEIEEERYVVHVYVDKLGNKHKYHEDELDEKMEEISAFGYEKVSERKMSEKVVHKYILSGDKVIEDCGLVAGEYVPLIPFYADWCVIENVERFNGIVRFSKDVQRLKNMALSKIAEISALSPQEKPIFTPEQIGQHQEMWRNDNTKNFPFLMVEPITDAEGNEVAQGPLDYTRVPQIPPATAAIIAEVERDYKELVGDPAAGEQIRSNVSGDAIEMIQTKLDMETYLFMSNFAIAMEHCGRVYLSMAKDVYNEKGREVKTMDISGNSGVSELMIEKTDAENGDYLDHDFTQAKMDVVVTVGPSSSTKKAAAVRALNTAINATSDPEAQQVLNAGMMMNMEGEGMEEIAEFYRKKLVDMQVLEPTEEDEKRLAEAQANAQPDPMQDYIKSETDKNNAAIAKTVSEIEENKAQTIKTEAETAEIYAAIERNDLEAVAKLMASRQPNVNMSRLNL